MTRQLVREGEGRARQEINNIERQVFGFLILMLLRLQERFTFECRCHNWETDVAANWCDL